MSKKPNGVFQYFITHIALDQKTFTNDGWLTAKEAGGVK